MEEIATLVIRVKSEEADAAKKRLAALGLQAKEAETATGGVTNAWKALTGVLAATGVTAAAIAGLTKLTNVARQFESLEAQLKTATGSAENAKVAFQAIQDFATQTPYDLAQSTEAFIKLVNLGLTPSERALRSYGDTASAMGKDLKTMVQAVANATTGEFEILKQFGVKSRTEADGISFSFRGVTTKVKNDAKSIEEYFIKLGETNFTGAMLERMNTLEGKISNLGDAWDVMFAAIAKAGAGDLIKDAIDLAIGAIEEFTGLVASGQLGGYVDALLSKFNVLADGVYNAFQNISDVLGMVFQYWASDGKGAVDFIINMFKEMPENIRAYVQVTGARFGALVGYAEAIGKGVYDSIAAWFNYLITTATNVGKEIADQLKNPFSAGQFDYVKAQAEAFDKFANKAGNAFQTTVDGLNNVSDAFDETVTSIMDERDASLAAFAAKIQGADALRDAYNKLKAASKEAGQGTDRLARFGVGTRGVTAEFTKLQESLRTQEKALVDSYNKRKALIMDNTEEEGSLRYELMNRLEEIYGEERRQLLDKIGLDLEVKQTAILDGQAMEMALLQRGYEDKQRALEDAREAELITEEEYQRRKLQLEERHSRDVNKVTTENFAQNRGKQLQVYSEVLGMAANIADTLSGMAQKGTAASKAAFLAAKAIAIAQAIVYTELAAVRALAEGGTFAGIPLSSVIRALGYASVGMMAAQTVMEVSQHEHGGMIGAGKFGITQEAGFELVQGPAVVTSARTTADKGLGGNETNVTVNVINQMPGAEVEERRTQTDQGELVEVIIKQAVSRVVRDIRETGGPVSNALQSGFGLRRGAA